MDEPVLRDDLLDGYERPYRRWLPVGWQVNNVPQLLSAALTLDVATVAAALVLVDGAPGALIALAALVTAVALVWTAWTTAVAVQLIRRRTDDWRAAGAELERVRAQRPHAADADPEVAHDEFAVAVDDRGELVTWRFTPLAATAPLPEGATLVRGTPCYAAVVAGTRPFAPADTALAAEQLADAQAQAAEREAAGAEAARDRLLHGAGTAELAAEARSTAEALRRHTGQ